jgi:hypothetical protein
MVICFGFITPTSRKCRLPAFRTELKRSRVCLCGLEIVGDGTRLSLRNVNRNVIPKDTKDSATVAGLLTKNARNPELFGEEIEFRKEK